MIAIDRNIQIVVGEWNLVPLKKLCNWDTLNDEALYAGKDTLPQQGCSPQEQVPEWRSPTRAKPQPQGVTSGVLLSPEPDARAQAHPGGHACRLA